MSVYGNKPAPYHVQGTAACLANIRRDCEKLRLMICETAAGDNKYALAALARIESEVGLIGGRTEFPERGVKTASREE